MVLKTSTRQTIFLPVVGLVDATALKPGDLVGVNKDSYLILDTLPPEYDSRVKVRGAGVYGARLLVGMCVGMGDGPRLP